MEVSIGQKINLKKILARNVVIRLVRMNYEPRPLPPTSASVLRSLVNETTKAVAVPAIPAKSNQKPRTKSVYKKAVTTTTHTRKRQTVSSVSKRKFICQICNAGFDTERGLMIHRRSHSIERPFSCDLCSKKFKRNDHLKSHMQDIHRKEKPHICETCSQAFSRPYSLSIHVRKVHLTNTGKYTCSFCDKRCITPSELETHILSHTKERHFWCELCGAAFRTKSSLNAHVALVHRKESLSQKEKTHVCGICSQAFSRAYTLSTHLHTIHSMAKSENYKCTFCSKFCINPSDLAIHTSGHTGEKPFQCDQCEVFFRHSGNLKAHVDKVHRKIPYTHFCDICNKGFHHNSRLINHKEAHLGHSKRKNKQCRICKKQFMSISNLNKHLKLHVSDERPRHLCSLCTRSYASSEALQRHIVQQHSEGEAKRFECEQCQKSYIEKSSLKEHIKVKHMSEITFNCSYCSLKLASKTGLRMHEIELHIRKDYRPHSCTFCDKTFKRKPDLMNHLKCHTDERAFSCQICSRSYKYSVGLRVHVESVHTRKRFACEQCSASFTTTYSRRCHVKLKHEGDSKAEPCAYCDKTFETKNSRKLHEMRMHTHSDSDSD